MYAYFIHINIYNNYKYILLYYILVCIPVNMTTTEFLAAEENWLEDESMVSILFGQLLLIVFYLLVVVVMLNLLIAIMGNAYDEIAKNEDVEMQRARAQAILYIERNILWRFMPGRSSS